MHHHEPLEVECERRLERLTERLEPRREIEAYFAKSGRTLRKNRFRLWIAKQVKPRIVQSLLWCLGLYARGKRNALQPSVRFVRLPIRDLPEALEGFTVLHLSDFHIDKMPGLAQASANLLNSLRPDLCVLTGDYRYEIDGPSAGVYAPMQLLLQSISAKLGVFGSLGNHDSAEIALRLQVAGVTVLVNDSARLQHNGQWFSLAGLDDSFDYRRDDLPLALADIPKEDFVILMAHTPELYAQAEARRVGLYLCGHTHAGQIRLPVIGAVKKNANCARKYIQGAWTYKRLSGYTSWGLGCSTLPVRYNCPPEIALLRLTRA